MKWDGHTHTPYCYHGSDEPLERYIDQAIELGFDRYTLSEHSPLPTGLIKDADLFKRLAMPIEELPFYIQYAKRIKSQYADKVDITVGLELDYLPTHMIFTEHILNDWYGELEDVIYSVHYLPGDGGMHCIDNSVESFRENIMGYYGSMENVVNEYYDYVEAAIIWIAQLPIRKRIGHINLIEKFASELPPIDENQVRSRLEGIIPLLIKTNVGVDVNTAGLRVSTCGKPYVPDWFLAECTKRGISCVYGSDAHKPEDVGTGWDWFEKHM
ncbi:histidinol-phosphatase HisJ [Paenibacillus solani]|uniref:histidinol-phosphatase HisJ n=1 Tax=Paenibacillus solani TaxID=1705565 RepID=UPI003D298F30